MKCLSEISPASRDGAHAFPVLAALGKMTRSIVNLRSCETGPPLCKMIEAEVNLKLELEMNGVHKCL